MTNETREQRDLREAWARMEREVNAASHLRGTMDWPMRRTEVSAAERAAERARLAASVGPLTMTVEQEANIRPASPLLQADVYPALGQVLAELDATRAALAAERAAHAATREEREAALASERVALRDALQLMRERDETDRAMADSVAALRASGAKVQCVYCGRISTEDAETIAAHTLTCAKRPEAALHADVERLTAERDDKQLVISEMEKNRNEALERFTALEKERDDLRGDFESLEYDAAQVIAEARKEPDELHHTRTGDAIRKMESNGRDGWVLKALSSDTPRLMDCMCEWACDGMGGLVCRGCGGDQCVCVCGGQDGGDCNCDDCLRNDLHYGNEWIDDSPEETEP